MAIFLSAYKRAFSAVHILHILQTLQRTGIWLVLAEIYIILARFPTVCPVFRRRGWLSEATTSGYGTSYDSHAR
jgi:hypothetical protein